MARVEKFSETLGYVVIGQWQPIDIRQFRTTYVPTYRHKWDGEDLADFISLSIYTGLRISDAAPLMSTA